MGNFHTPRPLLRVLARHGLERARVDGIALEAGTSKMPVDSNFGSKEGLFQAVSRERAATVAGGVARAEELTPASRRRRF